MHNLVSILAGAVAYQLLGALWYSPLLFVKAWMPLVGLTPKKIEAGKKKGMVKTYTLSFLCGLLIAYTTCVLFQRFEFSGGALSGLKLNLVLALGIVASTHLPRYLFQELPIKLYLIEAGFQVVGTILIGIVVGSIGVLP